MNPKFVYNQNIYEFFLDLRIVLPKIFWTNIILDQIFLKANFFSGLQSVDIVIYFEIISKIYIRCKEGYDEFHSGFYSILE